MHIEKSTHPLTDDAVWGLSYVKKADIPVVVNDFIKENPLDEFAVELVDLETKFIVMPKNCDIDQLLTILVGLYNQTSQGPKMIGLNSFDHCYSITTSGVKDAMGAGLITEAVVMI